MHIVTLPDQNSPPMTALDWIIIGAYFLIIVAIVWWSARQQKTSTDYFLAGRDVGWFAVGASLFASNIGSEHIVGLAGSGAANGMAQAHWELHAWIMIMLAWVFVLPELRQDAPAEVAPAAAKRAPTPQPLAQPTVEVPPQSEPAPARKPVQPRAAQPIVVTPKPAAEVTVAARPQPPAPSVVALRELPEGERLLYDGFTYSTHIYTDDPQLCAIVVDGIRLTAGDAFKGLIVDRITEQGVIFEEIRRGQRRLVEVSVMEQWDE